MMRKMEKEESKKYGCKYCTEAVKKKRLNKKGLKRVYWHCPYEECRYKEIGQCGSFKDYLKSEKSKMQFEILEGGVASGGDKYA